MLIFNKLEEWTFSGPKVLDTEFQKLIGLNSENKYVAYLEVIRQLKFSQKRAPILSFIKGYIHQRLGKIESSSEKETHFRKSLDLYQNFIDSGKGGNPDTRYFAQWQIGVLQQTLGMQWSVIEGSYLKTLEYDNTRAEAIRSILDYRCEHKEWRIAYVYSVYCINRFLGKYPVERAWFLDGSFYKWEILGYHLPILIAIRKENEAKLYLNNLVARVEQNFQDFSDEEKAKISNLEARINKFLIKEN